MSDLISKGALFNALANAHDKAEIFEIINDAPTVDAEPVRHGKWIATGEPFGWNDVECAKCSVCGEDWVLDEYGIDDFKDMFFYCPNCGADMRKESEWTIRR